MIQYDAHTCVQVGQSSDFWNNYEIDIKLAQDIGKSCLATLSTLLVQQLLAIHAYDCQDAMKIGYLCQQVVTASVSP